jgi:SpoIID/LytB domain protein
MRILFGIRARFGAASAACLALAIVLAAPLTARAADTTFTFTGGGYGHGIGLSQYGAKGFALQGRDYKWIVTHYFQGTTIGTMPMPTVRVDLDANKDARSTWRISAASSSAVLRIASAASATDSFTAAPGQVVWVTFGGGDLRITKDVWDAKASAWVPGAVLKTFTGSVYASTGSVSSSMVQIRSKSGPWGETYVKWRGQIRFSMNSAHTAANAVDYVAMEQYLQGVVPRESPSSWPANALKAQAVAARSYAYNSAVNGTVLYCTTMSQMYNGAACDDSSHLVHEVSSTNAAVAGTAGQVVKSGSTVVTTYFSSSSGGHTASIQDVWTGSAPKPYYVGVDDADSKAESGNPYATWSAGTFTGASIASSIRTHFPASSEPSPASVTSIATDRAASGFVRYVTMKWSNGASHKIAGDDLRHALGMKSAKYYIVTTPAPDPVARFEESDSRVAWAGAWATGSSTTLSGGQMRYASTSGATTYVSFQGTGFAWIGNRASSYGKAAVYLDGVRVATVDAYSAATSTKQRLFSRTGLAAGSHQAKIVVLREKNAASSGYTVAIDAVDISGGTLAQATAPPLRAEETDAKIAYGGVWVSGANPSLSSGTHLYTEQVGAHAYVSFKGTGVRWIGRRGTGYGTASVSLDGAAATHVSAVSSATANQQVLFSADGLDPAKVHTMVITATGAPTGSTAPGCISLDAIDVIGGSLVAYVPPTVRVQETATAVRFAGTWTAGTSSRLSGGAQKWSATSGSTAILAFEGNAVTWIGNRASSYGKAYVYVDGHLASTVDQYARVTAYSQRLFTLSGLKYGDHTLKIVVTHLRNRAARGYVTAVDAFDVTGCVASSR